MRTRFHTALKELLIKDDISFESELFNEWIYREAGVQYPPTKNNTILGFNFSPANWDTNEQITFKLPQLRMPSLKILLKFFQIPEDDYVTNAPLTLSEDYVFKVLLPKFVEQYATLKLNNDPLITKYREESKKIFAKSIAGKLKNDLYEVLGFMKKMRKSDQENNISYKLHCALMSLEHPAPYPAISDNATSAYKKVMEIEIPDVANEYLASKILAIKEGLAAYTSYHSSEAFPETHNPAKQSSLFQSKNTDETPSKTEIPTKRK